MREKTTAFLKGFCAVLVVIVLISVYVLVRHMGEQADAETTAAPRTDADGSVVPETIYAPLTGQCDLLLACAERDHVNFLLRAACTLDEKRITVTAVPLDLSLTYHGGRATVHEVYADGGAAALTACIGGYYGDSFDRYFFCTSDAFASVTRLLGDAEIEVRSDVSYVNGNTAISLTKGRHLLYGTDLYNYLMHAGEGEELLLSQAEAGAAMLSDYLSIKNMEQGESLFADIINYADSNITAYDFVSSRAVLEAAAASPEMMFVSGGIAHEAVTSP